MKPFFKHLFYLSAALCVLCLFSCGGDGSLSAGGGIGGTGVTSSGEITDIGSVWVNGVRFDTREADVYIDGVFKGSGDQSVFDYLDPGRVVQVNGRLDDPENGVAAAVIYESLLIGPIASIDNIDPYNTLLTILGQSVIISDRTLLKGATLNTLTTGNLVEVSGFFDDTGQIQASFLLKLADSAAPDAILKITGPVGDLDTGSRQFTINGFAVDYDQADLSALDPGGIADGMRVCASGPLSSGGSVLIADDVRPYKRLGDTVSGQIEIEGIVRQDTVSGPFFLEDYPFEITADTVFIGGTQEDLLAGVRIELEGELTQNTIAAEKITFSQPFRAESDLTDKDDANGTLELAGLEALTIETNALTRFSGLVDRFDDLASGNHLVIKGGVIGGTVLAWQVISLPEVQDKVNIRGTVLSDMEPSLSINGVVIDTDTIPDDGFFMDDEVPITRRAFWAIVAQGVWVEARGALPLLPGGSVDWKSVTLVTVD